MAFGFNIAPQGKIPLNGDSINNMRSAVEVLRHLQFDKRSFRTTHTGDGLFISTIPQVTTLGFPWGAEHPWGLKELSGADVTIAAGEFEAGNGYSLVTPETTFAITEDASYIGIKYNPDDVSLSLISPTTEKPVSGSGYFATWLYFFSYADGNATFVKHNLTGAWHAALFAATNQ